MLVEYWEGRLREDTSFVGTEVEIFVQDGEARGNRKREGGGCMTK